MAGEHPRLPPSPALLAKSVTDPRLEALDDQIAELVAEALFNRTVKNVLVNKVKQSKISVDGQETRQAHDC